MKYYEIIKNKRLPSFDVMVEDHMEGKLGKFTLFGFQVYVGRQGSGKTMAAVRDVLEIKKQFPKALVVCNVELFNIDFEYIYFETPDQLEKCLREVNNGTDGVIYLIDEIHNYFNSLDSKNIPIWVFQEISQQRKQRKLIVATSQLFLRVAKPLREQADHIIDVKAYLGYLQVLRVYDGWSISTDDNDNIVSQRKAIRYFWQSNETRHCYDTLQKIHRTDKGQPFDGSMPDWQSMTKGADKKPSEDLKKPQGGPTSAKGLLPNKR